MKLKPLVTALVGLEICLYSFVNVAIAGLITETWEATINYSNTSTYSVGDTINWQISYDEEINRRLTTYDDGVDGLARTSDDTVSRVIDATCPGLFWCEVYDVAGDVINSNFHLIEEKLVEGATADLAHDESYIAADRYDTNHEMRYTPEGRNQQIYGSQHDSFSSVSGYGENLGTESTATFRYQVFDGLLGLPSHQRSSIIRYDVTNVTSETSEERPIVLISDFSGAGLDNWDTNGNGTVDVVNSPDGSGDSVMQMDIDVTSTNDPVSSSILIDIPSDPFFINFDYLFQTPTGSLKVWLMDELLDTIFAIDVYDIDATELLTASILVDNQDLLSAEQGLLKFSLYPGSDAGILIGGVTLNNAVVPEPSTLAIFVFGMIGLASRRLKKI
jgi:hypothetical protein